MKLKKTIAGYINLFVGTILMSVYLYTLFVSFFRTLFEKYPYINIIVEDLGDLRPQVLELRDYFNFAGMRVLEFSIFDDEFNNKRDERANQIYYTSTHDNETLNEWLCNQSRENRKLLQKKMNHLRN